MEIIRGNNLRGNSSTLQLMRCTIYCLHSGNANHVPFLAILGIGGLGKTTLAQLIYNDERVENHFEKRIWVCVSEDFSVQRLTRLIVESLSGKSTDLKALEALQTEMKKLLSGKRFLLVLDDVWNEDQNEWNKLQASLTTCGGAKGSSIVLTTRLDIVASIMDDALSVLYRLRPLSKNECWSLFEARALGVGEDELPMDVKEIGKQIVNKCEGVPLAAKVLGGLMRSKREVREWESVRDNDLWKLPEGDAIMGILRLSYNHLRPELKQCFSYCSIFPKDYVIIKEELIQMWMANGFVSQSVVSGMELEDNGKQRFDELLRGSFFQDVEKGKFGEIESCKMHDLMHDLACHVSVGECCTLEIAKETRAPEKVRHLLVTGRLRESSSSDFHSVCRSNKSLRTLALPDDSHERSIDIIMKSKLNYLRVLNLNGCEKSHISVGHMKCLRYLNLSRMRELKSLPKSICRLIHLQTLKLVGCYELEKLPEEMKSMRQLRHLDIRGCSSLREMPSDMGQLTCLHTLSFFIVGQEAGRKINELKGLKHLGGELKLRRLDLVEDATEAKEVNLVSKRNLSSLELSWGRGLQENNSSASEEVLECLQPHSGLKELVIDGYQGAQFPSWFKSLSNLVSVELRRCVGIKTVLDEVGNLTALKSLRIEDCKDLKMIPDEIGNLTALTSLVIFKCRELISLPAEGLQKLTSLNLTSLEIWDCDSLKSLPEMGIQGAKNSLIKLKIVCCDGLTSLSGEPLRYLSSLQTLDINYCDNLELSNEAFQHLVSLRGLMLYELPKMTFVPDVQNLTALTRLQIEKCHELISLPAEGLQKLTSLNLTSLEIWDCDSLKSLPEMGIQGAKNSLIKLEIVGCDGLTSLSGEPLRYLSSLQTLDINYCDNLELSNEAFQHLVSLRGLWLSKLPKMTSVPDVQNLTALQYLQIVGCRNVRRLPQGLQHLTSLQTLHVSDCHPDLHKRMEKGKGEDWPMISHIPNITTTAPPDEVRP